MNRWIFCLSFILLFSGCMGIPSQQNIAPETLPQVVGPESLSTPLEKHSSRDSGYTVIRGQTPTYPSSSYNSSPQRSNPLGPNGYNRYPMPSSGTPSTTVQYNSFQPPPTPQAQNYNSPSGTPSQFGQGAGPGGGGYPTSGGLAPPNYPSPGAVSPSYPYAQGSVPLLGSDSIGAIDPYSGFQTAPVVVDVQETETGRFIFGMGVNSDAGISGNIVIDERNFDWRRWPTSFRDSNAFRGGGQGFRIEALPGRFIQRYMATFTEPYLTLFGTPMSLNLSAFLFDRRYFDWNESRVGGRIGLGYRLTHELSLSGSIRAEQVEIDNPRILGVPDLDAALGESDLYSGRIRLTHDTRDIPFAATAGHLIELSYEQVFGSFEYPRGKIDYRRYFLIRERPDESGRHVLSYSFRLGFSGPETPIFENFFAGGFSTMRGFDFRGASPKFATIDIGGEFQFLGSVEYRFPLTADDMLKGVVFCDYGTVEENIEINANNYRVAPGFGLRISIPAMGPAPIALDFAFPVTYADTDDLQVFSFFIGIGR